MVPNASASIVLLVLCIAPQGSSRKAAYSVNLDSIQCHLEPTLVPNDSASIVLLVLCIAPQGSRRESVYSVKLDSNNWHGRVNQNYLPLTWLAVFHAFGSAQFSVSSGRLVQRALGTTLGAVLSA